MIIIDAGPIVALLSAKDQNHTWCVQTVAALKPPLLTCEAALSEAFHLLQRRTSAGAGALGTMVKRGFLKVSFSFATEQEEVLVLLAKYSDQSMSFADACLVRMSELYPDHRVFTLDSDFRQYRRFGRRVIPLVTP